MDDDAALEALFESTSPEADLLLDVLWPILVEEAEEPSGDRYGPRGLTQRVNYVIDLGYVPAEYAENVVMGAHCGRVYRTGCGFRNYIPRLLPLVGAERQWLHKRPRSGQTSVLGNDGWLLADFAAGIGKLAVLGLPLMPLADALVEHVRPTLAKRPYLTHNELRVWWWPSERNGNTFALRAPGAGCRAKCVGERLPMDLIRQPRTNIWMTTKGTEQGFEVVLHAQRANLSKKAPRVLRYGAFGGGPSKATIR
jgi:hypothetical protein